MKKLKVTKSPNYNYVFDTESGNFARWGKTKEDDPDFSPFGPEILDIEVSTICKQGCSFCYKSNTGKGTNMSFTTFRDMFAKFPSNLTQIAFGIGDIDANPDLWDIMWHCRDNGIIPNITINGARMTFGRYHALARVCGAVAVSNYGKDQCYNAVSALAEARSIEGATLQQVNIHQLLSANTLDQCMDLLKDVQTDWRLEGLNAVVFLLMKPKGKRNDHQQLRDMEQYKALISYAMDNQIPIGFDSCSHSNFTKAVEHRPNFKQLRECAEPCESTAFSLYIDVEGKAFPCSFTPGTDGWEDGIDMLKVDDFIEDIWTHPKVLAFRKALIETVRCQSNCTSCQIYDLDIHSK